MLPILLLVLVTKVPLLAAAPATGLAPASGTPALSDVERSRLREKLFDFWSDVNLSIRNRNIDRYDLGRQEREMGQMGVFDKMPLNHCPESLRDRLGESAKRFGLYLSRVKVIRHGASPKPVPRRLFVDQGGYTFNQDQLVDTYSFELTVKGLESSLKDWSASWTSLPKQAPQPSDSPYLEADPGLKGGVPWRESTPHALIPVWKARLRGYCFRDVRFPKLILRDPVALLPQWARRDPEKFARKEPALWSTIEKTRELIPDARPLYATRERFLLNDARLSFFLKKMGE